MTEHIKVWLGRIAGDQAEAHERFVEWLCGPEAAAQFAKYGLSAYSLMQHGDLLKVIMRAEEPLSFIRFLRNQRLWPEFWEFTAAGKAEVEEAEPDHVGGDLRVRWRAGEAAGQAMPILPNNSEAG